MFSSSSYVAFGFGFACAVVACGGGPRPPTSARPRAGAFDASGAPSLDAPSTEGARGLAYPPAPRGDALEVWHGVRVADPYRALEALDAPATRAWVTAENQLTDAYFAKTKAKESLRARLTALLGHEELGLPEAGGRRFFWTRNDGAQDQAVLYTAMSVDGPATALLDPNVAYPDGRFALVDFLPSPDGARVAYGLSTGGGDWTTFRVRDTVTRVDLPDTLPNIKYYRPSFTKDGKGLYYSRFPAPRAGNELLETDHDCRVYFHVIGRDVSNDVVVYERPDHPTWQLEPRVTEDGRTLVITMGDGQVGDSGVEQIATLSLTEPHARPVALVDKFESEYRFLGSEGSVLYFKTTAGAPRKRIVSVDLRTPGRWVEVVPEGPEAIDDARLVGHRLVVITLKDAHHVVTIHDVRGTKLHEVALPGIGTVDGFHGRPDAKETYFRFTSFTTPGSVHRLDLTTGAAPVWKAPALGFDPESLETRQVFYPSKDGAKIPMFVTAKKGLSLDGSHPTLLTAYGGGGYAITPYFDASMIAWVERGGVFALANIRGGGEYGEAWHQASVRETRQVGYDDFIAAAEWLVASRHTSASRLGIFGVSNGGLLVAAVTMQRPDLFGAVAPIAGPHDLLRFPLFGQGAGWQTEIGSPAVPSQWKAMYAVSPLHNVHRGGHYPPMFIVTADHDVRVAPLHSYKLAATLQAAQTGASPILLRVETISGHGGGTTVSRTAEQGAELVAFFGRSLGMELE